MKSDTPFETATVAGGCFWCIASAFDAISGVDEVISGYTGGLDSSPTYESVCTSQTGHYEAVRIRFNPGVISYRILLAYFFQQIDPTDDGGSFLDRGSQYRSAVFYHSQAQQKTAWQLIDTINRSAVFKTPVATRVLPASQFFRAEAHHQDYHRKNPIQYRFYRAGSGRDLFIRDYWQNGNAAILFHDRVSGDDRVQDAASHECQHGEVEECKGEGCPMAGPAGPD